MRLLSALVISLVGLLANAFAQFPAAQLVGVFPAGAAAGATVEVTIAGNNLDDTNKLSCSHAGITAVQKMADATEFDEPRPIENVFLVSVAADTPPGRYEIRTHGKYGLSNPRCFVIGSLPEFVEVEPNGANELPEWIDVTVDGAAEKRRSNPAGELQLPVTINGQSSGGADVDWYRFRGSRGQRLLIQGFAKRIDSRMKLMVSLFESDGTLLGESLTSANGDPLLDVILPSDDEYFLKAHDALYQNGNGYTYRIEIADRPHLSFVFPPAGLPGSNDEYTVYGFNLTGGSQTNLSLAGQPLESAKVRIAIPADITDKLQFSSFLESHQAGIDGVEFRMSKGQLWSNSLLITPASAAIVMEQADNDRPETAQALSLPCELAGQFYPQRDVDWFWFEAKKAEVWAIELYSQRLGVPTDASLLIQRVGMDDAGKQTITNVQFVDDVQVQYFNNQSGRHEFNGSTTDPFHLFTVPEDGQYRVQIKEGLSSVSSDPRLIYRLAIRKPVPDFRIVAAPEDSAAAMVLRRGGRSVVRVFVLRHDGYNGEIRVGCEGLPPGVTSEAITIGPANTMGTLVLTTANDAAPTVSSLQVTAQAQVGDQQVVRKARYSTALESITFSTPNANLPSVPTRLTDGIQLCVTDYEPIPIQLTISGGEMLETSRGGVLKIPYVVQKTADTTPNLIAFPIDFPPSTTANQVNIGGSEKGEFELRFQAVTPPGTYTIYLAGFNQNYAYRRNPELADWATQRQERIIKILTEATERSQVMQQDATKKNQELQLATNALNQAKPVTQRAEQAVATAEAELKSAEAAVKQKAEAAAGEDAALKTQLEEAKKKLEEATKRLEAAKTAAADALKNQQAAEVALQTAQAAKTTADSEATAAREFQQRALQERQRTDQFANQKKNESNPRNINFNVPSNSLTVKVTEFPLTIDALTDQLTIKQEEKQEVAIKVSRLYDFKSNISVQTQLPSGVGGIGIQAINLAEGQAEGKFEITAQAGAPVGEHICTIRLQMNFNGQNLIMERPLKLNVIAK